MKWNNSYMPFNPSKLVRIFNNANYSTESSSVRSFSSISHTPRCTRRSILSSSSSSSSVGLSPRRLSCVSRLLRVSYSPIPAQSTHIDSPPLLCSVRDRPRQVWNSIVLQRNSRKRDANHVFTSRFFLTSFQTFYNSLETHTLCRATPPPVEDETKRNEFLAQRDVRYTRLIAC